MKKIVITGSKGLIGRKLTSHYRNLYDIEELDLALGHDLTDEKFVNEWFSLNKNIYATIICHAFNPVPHQHSKKIEPVDFSLKEIRDFMETNLISAYNICRNVIKNNDCGRIINISSIYGIKSPKHFIYKDFTKHIGYSLSKGSVIMLTKYLATYYKSFNINTIVLGGIKTPQQDETFINNYSHNVPKGRLMDENELTSVFDFLLNEKSTYISGTEIQVDGGWGSW